MGFDRLALLFRMRAILPLSDSGGKGDTGGMNPYIAYHLAREREEEFRRRAEFHRLRYEVCPSRPRRRRIASALARRIDPLLRSRTRMVESTLRPNEVEKASRAVRPASAEPPRANCASAT